MSFVVAPLPVALAAVSWLTTVSARNLAKCSLPCDERSYCDDFENKCKPCDDICSDETDLSDCRTFCQHHLHNIVHLYTEHKLQPAQLQSLTIMVTLTAVMTSVMMILLMALMFMKIKKRRRLAKKINPSVMFKVDKEKVNLSDTKMERLSAKELVAGNKQSEDINRSINTMTTQLSNESSDQSQNFPSGPMRNSKNSASLNYRTARLPSEDCVPNFARFNAGLESAGGISAREEKFGETRQYCEVV